MASTLDFYSQNAQRFYGETIDVDVQELYAAFLPLIPEGGRILDAGCGSGRDAKAFIQKGYRVTAFDACSPLAELAGRLIGQTVSTCSFLDFTTGDQFDGIWACASLLHVPASQLVITINHLAGVLAPSGFFYCSFKYGEGEVFRDGRQFTYMNEATLRTMATSLDLAVYKVLITQDARPERSSEQWLNVIFNQPG